MARPARFRRAEAGELGHWTVLYRLARTANGAPLQELAAWAIPIQERHFTDVKRAALDLASSEDPRETA